MAEVRLDLIKLDGLIRSRSADALLSDPELFGPMRDPGRLFSDLLRKAQISSSEAGGTPTPQSPAAGERSASHGSSDTQAAATSAPTEPERSAPNPPAQDRERKQSEDRAEQSAAGERTAASNEPAGAPAAPADTQRREEPSPDQDQPEVQPTTAGRQQQDTVAQATAARLDVSAASEAEGFSELQPVQALPEDVAEQKPNALQPDGPNAPEFEPASGQEGELVEGSGPDTEQQSNDDSAKDGGPKPPGPEAAPQRPPAAKATPGTDQATHESPAGRNQTTGEGSAGTDTVQATGKSHRSTGSTDSRSHAAQPASAVAAPVEQAVVANQAPAAPVPEISAVAAQTNQTSQQAGPSGASAPGATQPVAGEGEGARSAAAMRAETHQPARSAAAPPRDGSEGDTKAVDRVRFVQRVARAFEALGQHRGTLRLRLHPPELGSLRLEVSVERGVMTARLEAETHAARNLLLDNLPALRERLAQQDVRVHQFQVDLMDQPPGGMPDRMPEGWGSGRRPSDGQSNSQQATDAEETAGPDPVAVPRPGDGNRLNVVV